MEIKLYLLLGLSMIPVILIYSILLALLITYIIGIITGKKLIEISMRINKKYKE